MFKFVVSLLLLSFPLACSARAGTISISPSVSFNGETAVVSVSNGGDESARQVQVDVGFAGWERRGKFRPELPPGESLQEKFSLEGVCPPLPGAYPLRVLVTYADANGYSFSALLISPVILGKARRSALHLHVKPLELREQGAVECRVANLGGTAMEAVCRLETSPELRVVDPVRRLRLDPGRDRLIKFEVKNLAAVAPSSYPVYLVAEYDEDGLHHTALGRNMVTVLPGGRRSRAWFWGGAVLVTLAAAAAIYLGLRRRDSASSRR